MKQKRKEAVTQMLSFYSKSTFKEQQLTWRAGDELRSWWRLSHLNLHGASCLPVKQHRPLTAITLLVLSCACRLNRKSINKSGGKKISLPLKSTHETVISSDKHALLFVNTACALSCSGLVLIPVCNQISCVKQ